MILRMIFHLVLSYIMDAPVDLQRTGRFSPIFGDSLECFEICKHLNHLCDSVARFS